MSAYREKVTPTPPATVKTPLLARIRPHRVRLVGFVVVPGLLAVIACCVSVSARFTIGAWAVGLLAAAIFQLVAWGHYQ